MFWAVLGLVCVGLTWTLVGVVLGKAPQKGIPSEVVIFFSYAVPAIVGCIVLSSGAAGTVDWTGRGTMTGILYYSLSAFFNFFMMHLLSHAMQKGPNGIIWSITQSGMVLPFLYGVLFENDIVTVMRITGLLAAYFVQYRCMDYLSAHNHGSVAYPTLVASCLVGFALYSSLILREKTSRIQKSGMLLCVIGIILICLK